ncbi:ImmA/IrrE family metallo-endopeptidase [Paenibacillus albidus]|uniref:ImmA/IrrE family metallo-endopeptidase n=1 Tax=Paenibacillus albidus TaxID=2041023 RepID=UPI001BE5DCD7|nr:ImmA/IrrE family metallo-endopeptidase [Paenibacillus albidus]MBT2293432.1 ImmA/IrrE family metallo-endopeptidase [Paenibacillus albidus]
MKSYYQMTVLEKWTEDLYKRLSISHPSQISIEHISERLNIWVHYLDVRSKGIEATAGMYSMFIDNRLPASLQRLEFLHELCHLLRHAGSHSLMPERFTQEQEDESDRFILYAAMPYSMVSRMKLPELREDAIPYLAEAFQVPTELAMQRIDQIQRRVFQGQLLAVMGRQESQQPQSSRPVHSSRLISKLN